MKYRISDNTVELSLSELCAISHGVSPIGDLPPIDIYEREKTVFPSDYSRGLALVSVFENQGLRYELSALADGMFQVGREWTLDVVRLADAREMRAPRQEWKTYAKLLAFLLA
ncbi:MAG: hypothetical protein J6B12_01810 [Clostridia bacterium]|nr:hypothetical protein [Clostridia bacterium]